MKHILTVSCFFLNRALDSMAAGKRLPESRFSVLGLHTQGQKSLASMFSGVVNKENNGSS